MATKTKKVVKKEKEECKSCYGKGFYTQMYGKNYSADFEGDKSHKEEPTIHKIACPVCNRNNIKKLKGVINSIFE